MNKIRKDKHFEDELKEFPMNLNSPNQYNKLMRKRED